MNGWVKLHRKVEENSFLMNDNNAYMVFTKLLYMANSKGEWSGGRFRLSERVNLNDRTLYDVLKRLKSQQLINIKPNSKYTVISICNWSKYQSVTNSPTNNNPTTTQQHDNTLVRIEKKNKEKPVAVLNDGTGYKAFKNRRKALGL